LRHKLGGVIGKKMDSGNDGIGFGDKLLAGVQRDDSRVILLPIGPGKALSERRKIARDQFELAWQAGTGLHGYPRCCSTKH
jgi:hypothetical protein